MTREEIRLRAAHRCGYCQAPEEFSLATFHIEHIVARQHDGTDEAENLALACPDCNFLKGPNVASFDPQDRTLVRLFNPRTDVWAEHFKRENSHITGLTPIARATAQLPLLRIAELPYASRHAQNVKTGPVQSAATKHRFTQRRH